MFNMDLIGQRFGRLVVIERAENKGKQSAWICDCDCGNSRAFFQNNLLRGTSKSCGCLQKELLSERKRTHGGWANKEPLYEVWHGIRRRCDCVTDQHYPDYGGRGISYCEDWNDYGKFREWAMSSGYAKGLSINRIDNNGNYEPDNCEWTTSKIQQNNRRCNVVFELDGELLTLKQIAEKYLINYQTLYSRVQKSGWPIEEAVSRPIREKRQRSQ